MTIEYIDGFHELMKPAKSWDDLWSCCGDEESMFYLLNNGRYELCDLDEIDFDEIKPNLYFHTEWDCHWAAAGYYTVHHKLYPYSAEWNKCSQGQAGSTVVTEVESETMVFE